MRKRIYRTCLLLLLPLLGMGHELSAQCPTDTLIFEDFQGQSIPGTWVNLDIDSLADRAGRPANWWVKQHDMSSKPGAPNYAAASNSWFSPTGSASNWLILSSFEVCDTNIYLSWKSAPYEGPVYMDGYQVLLSTSTADADSFTVVLDTWAEGINATAQPSAGNIHTAYQGNRGLLQEWRIHLGPWLADTLFIAFHHNSTDDNHLFLDDIAVTVVPPFDATALSAVYSTRYPIVPYSQRTPMDIDATVRNLGYDTIPKLWVMHDIQQGGFPAYNATDTVLGLPGFTDSISPMPSAFTPSAVGSYTYTATVETDTTDGSALNDSYILRWEVSDSVYARDDDIQTGTRSLGASKGLIGQTYQLLQGDTMTSISVYLDNPGAGDTVRAVVHRFVGTPQEEVARTHYWVAPAGFSGWVNLGLEGIDKPLGAGIWLVAVEEQAGDNLNVGTCDGKLTAGAGWHRVGTAWASTDALELDEVYMIRANFGVVDEVVGRIETNDFVKATLFPNPAREGFTIRLGTRLKKAGTLALFDAKGVQVITMPVAAGTEQLDVKTQTLSSGMYFVQLRRGDEQRTWKLNVSEQ